MSKLSSPETLCKTEHNPGEHLHAFERLPLLATVH
jgi:hypothetical protein